MTKDLTKGDHVKWKTSQGTTSGTVVAKVTKTAKVKTHVAKATAADPQYKVKSDQTGAMAIHKPDSLKKTKS